MSRFDAGHRVIVVRYLSDEPPPTHHPEAMIGHYGHVKEILGTYVLVNIQGKVGGMPHPPVVNFSGLWAFHIDELEHAD